MMNDLLDGDGLVECGDCGDVTNDFRVNIDTYGIICHPCWLERRAERAEAAFDALRWQPGSEPPPHPGQYEVASRRDRFNGLGERAPGAGPWFYEHRNWTGKRWTVNETAAAVLWWRVVPPIPEEGQTG